MSHSAPVPRRKKKTILSFHPPVDSRRLLATSAAPRLAERKSANWIILGRSCLGKKSGAEEGGLPDMPPGGDGGGGGDGLATEATGLFYFARGATAVLVDVTPDGRFLPLRTVAVASVDGLIFLMRGTADTTRRAGDGVILRLPPLFPLPETRCFPRLYCSVGDGSKQAGPGLVGDRQYYCLR